MTHHDPTAMLPEMELAYSYSRETQNSCAWSAPACFPDGQGTPSAGELPAV